MRNRVNVDSYDIIHVGIVEINEILMPRIY